MLNCVLWCLNSSGVLKTIVEGYIGSIGTHFPKGKKDGGDGFKDFYSMNRALVSKQAWCLATNQNELWTKLLKTKCFLEVNFSLARK